MITLGWLLLAAAAVLWAAETRRAALANPTSRLPHIGWRFVSPRYHTLIIGVGSVLATIGLVSVGEDDNGIVAWRMALAFVTYAVAALLTTTLPIVIHNRRVGHPE